MLAAGSRAPGPGGFLLGRGGCELLDPVDAPCDPVLLLLGEKRGEEESLHVEELRESGCR